MAESEGVRPVQQARSARTRDRILAVIEKSMKSDSLADLTIQEIVRQAGCSVGAFYGRFADKDAAIASLYDERRRRFVENLTDASREATEIEAWARRLVDLALAHAMENRALLVHAAGLSRATTIFAEARIANLEMVNLIAACLTRNFGLPISTNRAASAAAFVLAMIGAMTRDAAVFSKDLLGPERNREWYAAEITRAVAAYLRSDQQ